MIAHARSFFFFWRIPSFYNHAASYVYWCTHSYPIVAISCCSCLGSRQLEMALNKNNQLRLWEMGVCVRVYPIIHIHARSSNWIWFEWTMCAREDTNTRTPGSDRQVTVAERDGQKAKSYTYTVVVALRFETEILLSVGVHKLVENWHQLYDFNFFNIAEIAGWRGVKSNLKR